LEDTIPRAQTVLTYFLSVCVLLGVVFVEPPNRFWAAGGEASGDRRLTWLVVGLLIVLLAVAFVPALAKIFDLRPTSVLDMLAAAVWVFLVRFAWERRLLERFLGADPAR
jgi:cation-transporting P-type ATPase E